MTSPPKWFTDACAMHASDEDDAIYVLYNNLDNMLTQKRWDEVNELMRHATNDISNIPTDLLFGIITLTDHGRHFLSLDDRWHLYEATKRAIKERGEWEEDAFRGFTFSKPLS